MTGQRGQSAIELALLLVLSIAALVTMWPLLRNAVGSRFRSTADSFSYGLQYDPETTRIRGCQPGAVDADGNCTAYEP